MLCTLFEKLRVTDLLHIFFFFDEMMIRIGGQFVKDGIYLCLAFRSRFFFEKLQHTIDQFKQVTMVII